MLRAFLASAAARGRSPWPPAEPAIRPTALRRCRCAPGARQGPPRAVAVDWPPMVAGSTGDGDAAGRNVPPHRCPPPRSTRRRARPHGRAPRAARPGRRAGHRQPPRSSVERCCPAPHRPGESAPAAGVPGATAAQGVLLAFPAFDEGLRVGIEGQPATDDLCPLGRRRLGIEAHVEAETVEQLRAQFALFRVHRADQHETRRMPVGNAIALDQVDAAGGDVEQQIHQVVRQQVNFVDVEHAAVGLGQHARGKPRATFAEGGVQVEAADDALLAGAQRQGNELARRQQFGDAPRQGRLGHSARPLDQYPADRRIDRGQAQRQLQFVGGDHGGQGVMHGSAHGDSCGGRTEIRTPKSIRPAAPVSNRETVVEPAASLAVSSGLVHGRNPCRTPAIRTCIPVPRALACRCARVRRRHPVPRISSGIGLATPAPDTPTAPTVYGTPTLHTQTPGRLPDRGFCFSGPFFRPTRPQPQTNAQDIDHDRIPLPHWLPAQHLAI